jgi:hypothetical protein
MGVLGGAPRRAFGWGRKATGSRQLDALPGLIANQLKLKIGHFRGEP